MTATTIRSVRHRVPLSVSAVAIVALAGMAGAVPAGVASAASGNGVSSLPPSKIVETGLQTTKAARSFTAVGHVSLAGTTIGLHVTDAGNGNGSGTIVADGLTARFVKVGKTIYVRAKQFVLAPCGRAEGGEEVRREVDRRLADEQQSRVGRRVPRRPAVLPRHVVDTDIEPRPQDDRQGDGQRPPGRRRLGKGADHRVRRSVGRDRYMVATTGKPYLLVVAGHLQAAGLSVSLSVTFSNLDQAITVRAPSGAVAVTLPTTATTSTTGAG